MELGECPVDYSSNTPTIPAPPTLLASCQGSILPSGCEYSGRPSFSSSVDNRNQGRIRHVVEGWFPGQPQRARFATFCWEANLQRATAQLLGSSGSTPGMRVSFSTRWESNKSGGWALIVSELVNCGSMAPTPSLSDHAHMLYSQPEQTSFSVFNPTWQHTHTLLCQDPKIQNPRR